jgi:hypothetical protein
LVPLQKIRQCIDFSVKLQTSRSYCIENLTHYQNQ